MCKVARPKGAARRYLRCLIGATDEYLADAISYEEHGRITRELWSLIRAEGLERPVLALYRHWNRTGRY